MKASGLDTGTGPSLVERIYDNTRTAILDGRYKPGQRLRLQDIAAENAASFIPVREALRLLEVGRLVEIIPNKGARVAEISEEDMVDAYDLRLLLETMALERACSRITPEEVTRARHLHAAMMDAFSKGLVEQASLHHRDFHLTLYSAARSNWLSHVIELLMASTDRYRRLLTPARPSQSHLQKTSDQHGAILEAVARGDPAAARTVLQEHLSETVQRFRAKLSRD